MRAGAAAPRLVVVYSMAAVGRRAWPLWAPGALLWPAALLTEGAGRLRGRPVALDREKARELAASWPVSTAKARRLLGWSPRVPLEDGVRAAVEWYRAEGWC